MPSRQLTSSPAEVVMPLIWFREEMKRELVAIMVVEITAATLRRKSPVRISSYSHRSAIMAMVPARDTSMKVRSPAECRLLDRSVPMIADSTAEQNIRSSTDQILISPAQGPSSLTIGSFSALII